MSANSKIEWTQATWNPIRMSDLFHENLPDEAIDHVFAVMALCPQHTFQVLTKRADRMRQYFEGDCMKARIAAFQWEIIEDRVDPTDRRSDDIRATALDPEEDWPLANVRLGVSIENQEYAAKRFPAVCELGEAGWNTMVSLEPLLGPVVVPDRYLALGQRAWVIVGGESGPGVRPFDIAWARSIVQQCKAAGVPCFVKQIGSRPVERDPVLSALAEDAIYDPRATASDIAAMSAAANLPLAFDGKLLRDKKGGDPDEWPEDLRVREMPEGR